MDSHINAILDKMTGLKYSELTFEMAHKLTNESERGALLIGVGKIEEYLEKLINKILPAKQKNYTLRLLNYPGPLSSFSGKIELLYAFRIIDKRLYDSITILRKLRNKAAHSSEIFSLQDTNESLDKIYDFEYGFKEVVHKLAYDHLIKWKIETIKDGFKGKNMDKIDVNELWTKYYDDLEHKKIIQEQLTIWKLAYGLTFLCLKIEVLIDEFDFLDESNEIWIHYIKSNK
ncbi:MAG: hypothetical protein P4L28_02270 [Paludibacteraceae bacterium]|nr:hypothetical protein [Paludibacteraceae bacterium]